VQDVLDRNAVLIRQVAANHDARTRQSVAANAPLLSELRAGVQRAVELYRGVAEALLGGGGASGGGGAGGTTTGGEEEEDDEDVMEEGREGGGEREGPAGEAAAAPRREK
jgi:hypothetical protein